MSDYDNDIFRLATAQEAEPEDYTGEDGRRLIERPRGAARKFRVAVLPTREQHQKSQTVQNEYCPE